MKEETTMSSQLLSTLRHQQHRRRRGTPEIPRCGAHVGEARTEDGRVHPTDRSVRAQDVAMYEHWRDSRGWNNSCGSC